MTKDELKYNADQLLAKGRIRTPNEQNKLNGILLNLEGMNIKVTGHQDNVKKNQVPRIRRRKKHINNLQLKLTF